MSKSFIEYKGGEKFLPKEDLNLVRSELDRIRNQQINLPLYGIKSKNSVTLGLNRWIPNFKFFEAQGHLEPDGTIVSAIGKEMKFDFGTSDWEVIEPNEFTIVDFFQVPFFKNDRILAAQLDVQHEEYVFIPLAEPKLFGVITESGGIPACTSGEISRYKGTVQEEPPNNNFTAHNRHDWPLENDWYSQSHWDRDALQWVIHAADCNINCFVDISTSEG